MQVFTCEDRFEDMMTCIYTAWAWALENGHEQMRLQREPVEQMELFDSYSHVDGDEETCRKVLSSIRKKIGMDAYVCVCYAAMYGEDVLDDIYRFLRIGFARGEQAVDMLTEPAVLRMMEIRRSVGREIHYFREFVRFDEMIFHGEQISVYVSHIEPKHNVVYEVALYFAERMPSEAWMIVDDSRSVAAVHPADGEVYLRQLSSGELQLLRETERQRDSYSELWQTFFEAVAIRRRENRRCQRNLFPIRLRSHATEFRSK